MEETVSKKARYDVSIGDSIAIDKSSYTIRGKKIKNRYTCAGKTRSNDSPHTLNTYEVAKVSSRLSRFAIFRETTSNQETEMARTRTYRASQKMFNLRGCTKNINTLVSKSIMPF